MKALSVIFAIALIIGVVVWLHRRAALFHAFAQLAQRYRGRAYTTWGANPGAIFPFRDSAVRITSKMRLPIHGGRQTSVALDWIDRRFQLVAWTRDSRFRRPYIAGLQSVALDSPELNARMEVWTNDPAVAQSLLAPASTWQLRKLIELAARGQILWSIRRGRFQVQLRGQFRTIAKLAEVVEAVLYLYSQAQLTQQRGMDFVDDQSARVIEEMICPICSGKIANDVAICTRCRTPHCKECWQYNGKCATFGCGGERYVTAASASPT